jgi:hypothetical protein
MFLKERGEVVMMKNDSGAKLAIDFWINCWFIWIDKGLRA